MVVFFLYSKLATEILFTNEKSEGKNYISTSTDKKGHGKKTHTKVREINYGKTNRYNNKTY